MSILKVLHVIPAVAPRYGGPSRAVFEMCRALNARGVETLIATTDADGPGRLPVQIAEPALYNGTQTIFFPRQWSETFGYSHALALWLDVNASRFDVAHIHAVFSHPCIAAAAACRKRRVPYIIRPLGSLDPWSMSQKAFRKRIMWRVAVKRMLDGAAAIHYTTADEQRLAEGSLAVGRGVVVPLGVEIEPTPERAQPVSGPYVITLNRLHPKKNIELLLKVFLSITKAPELSHWKLVIAGDGEPDYVERLKRIAKEYGAGERVVFTGWLGGPERVSALRGASLLALISHQENFGLAAVEALACGVPVIVSRGVNLASKIEESGAGWVTPLDEASISRALSAALSDPDELRRRGETGPGFIASSFAWSKVAANLTALYNSVVSKKREPELKITGESFA
jgi:glycosyltransferase involved in cell wall biosynthesis